MPVAMLAFGQRKRRDAVAVVHAAAFVCLDEMKRAQINFGGIQRIIADHAEISELDAEIGGVVKHRTILLLTIS